MVKKYIMNRTYLLNPIVFEDAANTNAENLQKPFKLYAAMFIWFESDIIEAIVKNLFAEGCDKVYFIDNGSPDETINTAIAAGAIHWDTIYSKRFEVGLKTEHIADLVRIVSNEDDSQRVWWMLNDADEFPTGPGERTIKQYLQTLDDKIRCVGGRWLNHIPAYKPFYISKFHPIEFQPEAALEPLVTYPYCVQNHDKHNLLRQDKGKDFLWPTVGFHSIYYEEKILEPSSNIWIHHFRHRAREFTELRLKALAIPDENGESRLGDREFHEKIKHGLKPYRSVYIERMRQLEKVYARDLYPELYSQKPFAMWKDILSIEQHQQSTVSIWYDETDLIKSVIENCTEEEFVNWRCLNLFSKQKFNTMLKFFNRNRDKVNLWENSYKYYIETITLIDNNMSTILKELGEMLKLFPDSKYAQNVLNILKATLKR